MTVVLRARPPLVWIVDVGVAGLLVAVAATVAGGRVVLDTGDEHMALMRRTDEFRGVGLWLSGVLERLLLARADRIVARGRSHVVALRGRGYNAICWLPDGCDVGRYTGVEPHPWRQERGWQDDLVVACVGSMMVDRRYGKTPGWELVEALALVPEARGALVGDGPGRPLLEKRVLELGVADRVAFLGWRPPEELPALIRSFDMCLSTQTDDTVGHARTSGKLPLFMAAGRFVLASDVGEARRVLPATMRVRYRGEFDPDYPRRLASRIAEVVVDRGQLAAGSALVATARELFDYRVIERRAAAVVAEVAG